MPNGMQIAVSGMLAQQARLDAIANDLANVNTAGYRGSRLVFQEIVTPAEGNGSGGGVRALDGGRSSAQGTLLPSESPLSVALQGTGYIQVKLADGSTGLSRGGDLRLDGKRSLVLPTGERLEPPVTVPAGLAETDVAIAGDGTVTGGGKRLGRVTIVDVPAPAGLVPAGNGLLAVSTASGPATPSRGTTVVQGYLESSAVDVAGAMVAMIEAQRAFELASRAIHVQDRLLQIQNEIRR